MSQTSVHQSVSLAALPYEMEIHPWQFIQPGNAAVCKSICSLCLLIICNISLTAQDSATKARQDTSLSIFQLVHLQSSVINGQLSNTSTSIFPPVRTDGALDRTSRKMLTPKQVRSRVRILGLTEITGYSAMLVAFNADWYANYPRSSFHFFNDNAEWLQVDKAGHMFGAYTESRLSMELWRWTGIDRKKRIWYGGLSGIVYQTIIETLDGFSSAWGWSWGDITANIVGSGSLIAQELAWNDQRIKLKFSFHRRNYGDSGLNKRADMIYGKTLSERFIKDYNAITFWASGNLRSFFPHSNLPAWLSLAVGYGAEGMFGARDNLAKDDNGNVIFDRRDIKRYRQWFLSPDIDFAKIKTNKKVVRLLFTLLNTFKFPAPSLEFSKGRFKVNALHF